MRCIKLIIFVFTAAIIFTGCSSNYNSPGINQGILDLTDWDPAESSALQLDGEWEFYWNKFLSYSDFQKVEPDIYINVPSTWNEYAINDQSLSGQGYATYRLHVKTDLTEDTLLGLRIYPMSSAYRVYINDRLVAGNGSPGKTAADEIGEYRPQAVIFNAPAGGFDIIVQISNFEYARGGLWYGMYLGSQEKIQTLHENIMEKETFLLGTLVILSAFLLAVYFLKKELKYFLYLACLCLFMAVSLDMVGQFILLRFLPQLSLKTVIFIWYSSTTWLLVFLLLFYHELYTSRFSNVCLKTYFVIAVLQQLFFLLAPTTIYTGFGRICDMIDVIAVVCTVIIVVIGTKKGMRDGLLNLAGMMIVLVTYIHDNLYWTNVINSSYGEIVYIGLFWFLLFQMVILARRIKEFHEQKTTAELAFLQAQIKPHFLFNAINTFISISFYDIDKARELLLNFGNYLRGSFDFKDLSQLAPLKNEIGLVRAYLEIEKARFEERVEVSFDLPDDLETRVPILMLQPIIENALIHGILPKDEGGHIEICIQRDDKALHFRVKDNGIGMEQQKKADIFKREFGHGVGLSNIDSRLRKLYKKGLQINSMPGAGTEVTWHIPVNHKENGRK